MSLAIAAASFRMRLAGLETNSIPYLFDRQVTRILVCRLDGVFEYGNVSVLLMCRLHMQQGTDGIGEVSQRMPPDVDITMTLCGCSNLSEANGVMLVRVSCAP